MGTCSSAITFADGAVVAGRGSKAIAVCENRQLPDAFAWVAPRSFAPIAVSLLFQLVMYKLR